MIHLALTVEEAAILGDFLTIHTNERRGRVRVADTFTAAEARALTSVSVQLAAASLHAAIWPPS